MPYRSILLGFVWLLALVYSADSIHRLRNGHHGHHGGSSSMMSPHHGGSSSIMDPNHGKGMSGYKKRHSEKNTEPFNDDQPTRCVSVSSAAELQELLQPETNAGIRKISLCSTEIPFEETVQLPRFTELECPMGNRCVFDGQNQRRLFTYTVDATLPPQERYASMIFDNIVFQNGNANGGGAIKFVGETNTTASRAMFRNCAFQNNNGSYSHNGGAIDADPWFSLDIINTIFIGNTAYTGGAIHALDTQIFLRNATFVNNTVCGGGEGPAIYVSQTTTTPAKDYVGVQCAGDDNVFEMNLDGICLSNYSHLDYPDVVAPKVIGCGEDDTAELGNNPFGLRARSHVRMLLVGEADNTTTRQWQTMSAITTRLVPS
eukprot:scaffold2726_cov167-Amphora_coffeaeformis.AAC.20